MKLIRTRLLLPLLAALFLTVGLSACGGSPQSTPTDAADNVVGIYRLRHISAAGLDLDADALSQTMGTQISIQLEVKADGTFVVDSAMPELNRQETISGTWSQEEDTLTFATDSEELPVTLSDGLLTLEQDGQSLVFEKT
ncbi:hypothetical protein [uncultured Flavonifractor sp.]|uniref:Lipocalin-like domain-containing protein n=1 Tax=Candidatus Flavonifractor intestinigallinarum TaxID=2838586 RepID=A0A9D2MPA1_9FIRM|nr:hypothetical protein [uncultured Flavonifractor sp.]HJB81376.1 hypothetical protein [Candidatus Flavonifractor intestinigallinarum]